jgi:hypothetical protein
LEVRRLLKMAVTISLIISSLSFLVAATSLYRTQRRDKRADVAALDEDRSAEARRVSAWVSNEHHPNAPEGQMEWQPYYMVRNGNDVKMSDVLIYFKKPGMEDEEIHLGVLPPRQQHSTPIPSKLAHQYRIGFTSAPVTFRDSRGVKWHYDENNLLTEIR